jgi:hypothetical protein
MILVGFRHNVPKTRKIENILKRRVHEKEEPGKKQNEAINGYTCHFNMSVKFFGSYKFNMSKYRSYGWQEMKSEFIMFQYADEQRFSC